MTGEIKSSPVLTTVTSQVSGLPACQGVSQSVQALPSVLVRPAAGLLDLCFLLFLQLEQSIPYDVDYISADLLHASAIYVMAYHIKIQIHLFRPKQKSGHKGPKRHWRMPNKRK